MLRLEPILTLEDNYVWAVHDGCAALLVDPGEALPILTWLADRRMRPAAILITHRHGDHTGGIAGLLAHYPDLPVHGPTLDAIPGVNAPAGEGDTLAFAEPGLCFTVMAVPGHTRGHLAYHGHGWLFCGDTLFSCGCGKVLDCSPEQLHASLSRLAALPADTLVCCAHEYTEENIRFALTMDPDNVELVTYGKRVTALRRAGLPSLPSRLGDELACNPFLRCQDPALRRRLAAKTGCLGYPDAASAFVALRELKNRFH